MLLDQYRLYMCAVAKSQVESQQILARVDAACIVREVESYIVCEKRHEGQRRREEMRVK